MSPSKYNSCIILVIVSFILIINFYSFETLIIYKHKQHIFFFTFISLVIITYCFEQIIIIIKLISQSIYLTKKAYKQKSKTV